MRWMSLDSRPGRAARTGLRTQEIENEGMILGNVRSSFLPQSESLGDQTPEILSVSTVDLTLSEHPLQPSPSPLAGSISQYPHRASDSQH